MQDVLSAWFEGFELPNSLPRLRRRMHAQPGRNHACAMPLLSLVPRTLALQDNLTSPFSRAEELRLAQPQVRVGRVSASRFLGFEAWGGRDGPVAGSVCAGSGFYNPRSARSQTLTGALPCSAPGGVQAVSAKIRSVAGRRSVARRFQTPSP